MNNTSSPPKSQDEDLRLSPYQQANEYYACDDEMINQLQLEKENQFKNECSARRNEYTEYLKSDVWASKRARVLKRNQYICQACLTRMATQVHHKKYPENFGNEPLFDLVSVCNTCHWVLHEIER